MVCYYLITRLLVALSLSLQKRSFSLYISHSLSLFIFVYCNSFRILCAFFLNQWSCTRHIVDIAKLVCIHIYEHIIPLNTCTGHVIILKNFATVCVNCVNLNLINVLEFIIWKAVPYHQYEDMYGIIATYCSPHQYVLGELKFTIILFNNKRERHSGGN